MIREKIIRFVFLTGIALTLIGIPLLSGYSYPMLGKTIIGSLFGSAEDAERRRIEQSALEHIVDKSRQPQEFEGEVGGDDEVYYGGLDNYAYASGYRKRRKNNAVAIHDGDVPRQSPMVIAGNQNDWAPVGITAWVPKHVHAWGKMASTEEEMARCLRKNTGGAEDLLLIQRPPECWEPNGMYAGGLPGTGKLTVMEEEGVPYVPYGAVIAKVCKTSACDEHKPFLIGAKGDMNPSVVGSGDSVVFWTNRVIRLNGRFSPSQISGVGEFRLAVHDGPAAACTWQPGQPTPGTN